MLLNLNTKSTIYIIFPTLLMCSMYSTILLDIYNLKSLNNAKKRNSNNLQNLLRLKQKYKKCLLYLYIIINHLSLLLQYMCNIWRSFNTKVDTEQHLNFKRQQCTSYNIINNNKLLDKLWNFPVIFDSHRLLLSTQSFHGL